MNLSAIIPRRTQSVVPSWPATRLFAAVSLLAVTGCSVFGVASVEEADYQRVRQDEAFEIRDYAPLVVAETRVAGDFREAGNRAFRRLFDYISGENAGSQEIAMTAPVIAEAAPESARDRDVVGEKIAMTAPVIAEQAGDAWVYRFVLPARYTLASAPQPLNPDVSLAEVAPRRVAVVRYSGRSSDAVREKATARLRDWIASEGLTERSDPRWAGYNPPWTLPPFRRNEVLIDVSER